MASEATITVGLTIQKTSGTLTLLDARRSAVNRIDVTGTKGPTPGAVTIPTDGVAINLSALTTPGVFWVENQDATNYFALGIRDPDSSLFYPMLEFPPGMRLPLLLSRDLFEEYQGTGTGTGTPANQLWAKAFGAAVVGSFEVWEK